MIPNSASFLQDYLEDRKNISFEFCEKQGEESQVSKEFLSV